MILSEYDRDPELRIIFAPVTYDQAAINYIEARAWCTNNGLVYREDVFGIIRSPRLPGLHDERVKASEITPEMMNKTDWLVIIDLWVSCEMTLESILSKTLPDKARLVRGEAITR